MTTYEPTAFYSPLTNEYQQQDVFTWRNPATGDQIFWDSSKNYYLGWQRDIDSWFRWAWVGYCWAWIPVQMSEAPEAPVSSTPSQTVREAFSLSTPSPDAQTAAWREAWRPSGSAITGPVGEDTPTPRRYRSIDFWISATVGLLLFAGVANGGHPGIGALVLVVFLAVGLMLSSLHTNNPAAHRDVLKAAALGLAVAGTVSAAHHVRNIANSGKDNGVRNSAEDYARRQIHG